MEREHLSKTDSYLSDFLDYLKNEKLYTNDTLKNYQIDLKQISEFLHSKNQDLYTADRIHIESFFMKLNSLGLSPSSLARKASTLRSYFLFLVRTSVISTSPMIEIKTPKLSKKLPDILSISDVDTLCNIDASSSVSKRDRAIIEVMYSSALRLSELSSLNTESVDIESK